MPGRVFASAVGAVDWSALRSTYGSRLTARLRAGEDAECDAFGCIFSLLLNLMDYGGNLIGQPR
jgi:hypothetical protein